MENSQKAVRNGQAIQDDQYFTDGLRDGLYKTIFSRRDVRGQFLPQSVPDEVMARVLLAAHHAPSVGFMQPWNFVMVQDQDVKKKVHAGFTQAHQEAAEMFGPEKGEVYSKLKLEGILESPINICVTCDRERAGPVVIGRTHIPEMDLFSSVCAVQNLWLAARAEGLGVGWVSIIEQESLKEALKLPDNIFPVAYLCVGYVSHFYDKPELESAGWRQRLPLEELLYKDQWGTPLEGSLPEAVAKQKAEFTI
ncbi:MAG: 5,6-dimethylbenzimidazole synthase [Rhodospirillales bacterium]|nr:5,6-dimethylbenzimidazole synthase [Rhodospirillales bacterium]